jgi:transcriptional regulator with XRE-family HTH domain
MGIRFGKPNNHRKEKTMVKFDYSKLRGRIKERGYTQETLAAMIPLNPGTLSEKLNGASGFTTNQIDDICRILDISNNEIGSYFFSK